MKLALAHLHCFRKLLRSFAGLVILTYVASPTLLYAQPSYQYVYDETNQLVKVLDSTGVLIEYVYDEVGNILEVKRSMVAPLAILDVIPGFGATEKLITIRGIGFSEVLIENEVAFNGVPADVASATTSTLEVTVPVGATTGPVSITVMPDSASWDRDFIVLQVPIIDSIYPYVALPDSIADDIVITGENLVQITFEFLPPSDPPQLLILPLSISPDGLSAIIDIAVSADALGDYVLTATNEAGTSDATPSPANTFIVLANGDGDADGDGLTDGEEITLRTDPFNEDTDGDGWLDPLEIDGESDPLDPDSVPFIGAYVSRPRIRVKRIELGTEPAGNTLVVSRPRIRAKLLGLSHEPANNTLVVSRPRIRVKLFGTSALAADNTIVVSRPRIEVTILENGAEAADNTVVAKPPSITVELEDL